MTKKNTGHAAGRTILENAIESFDGEAICGPIEVPPWGTGDAPALIYYRRVTLAELAAHKPKIQRDAKGWALFVTAKALNEKGDKLFTVADAPAFLAKVDPHVVQGVGSAILDDNPMLAIAFMPDEEGDSAAKLATLAGAVGGVDVPPAAVAAASEAAADDAEGDPAGN